jgi:hypothetical protein
MTIPGAPTVTPDPDFLGHRTYVWAPRLRRNYSDNCGSFRRRGSTDSASTVKTEASLIGGRRCVSCPSWYMLNTFPQGGVREIREKGYEGKRAIVGRVSNWIRQNHVARREPAGRPRSTALQFCWSFDVIAKLRRRRTSIEYSPKQFHIKMVFHFQEVRKLNGAS